MAQLPDSTFQFTGIFNKTSTPKSLVVRDDTDWAPLIAAGYTPLGIFLKSVFTYSGGSTVIYDNLSNSMADTDYDITYPDTESGNQMPLPLQTDGNAAFGVYTIYLEYRYTDDLGVKHKNIVSASFEYQWVPPAISIAHNINLASSVITSIDTTNYGANILSLVRQHIISPPANAMQPPLNLTAQTTSLATNVYNNITTGTWSVKINTTVTYQLDAGWNVIEFLTGCIEFPVFSTIDLNKLLCCLDNYKKRYERELVSNYVAAENTRKSIIEPVLLNIGFYYMYLQAGCMDKAAAAIEAIRNLTGCGDCSCGGDECPTPIPAITTASNFYDLDSPDNSITVTSDVIGNTTVFHVKISQSVLNQLSNIKTYNVNGVSPIVVTTTTSPNGLTVTYSVQLERPMPMMQNLAVVRVKIYYNSGWQIERQEIFTDTQSGVVSPFAMQNMLWAAGTTPSDPVAILFTNFFTSRQPFVCRAQVMNWYSNADLISILPQLKKQNIAEANVMWVENVADRGNMAIIRLYNPINGEVLSFSDLNINEQYFLTISVQAAS